jgi:hypothetical protein
MPDGTNFKKGLSVYGLPVLPIFSANSSTGDVYFLDSGNVDGSDNPEAGSDISTPFSTLDYAIGQCTANNGDVIYVAPGHAETITASNTLALDVAGVAVIGMGYGADRPTFSVGTDAAATITISGASVSMMNVIVKSALDGLNTAMTITGASCYLDIEHQDTSATVEANIAITCTGDQFVCRLRDIGFAGGNARTHSIVLTGVDNARIDIDHFGKPSTAVVDFVTTACTDVEVRGTVYVSGTTDGSKNVLDTATGSTWYIDIIDAAAGSRFTGGSASAPASDDISTITALIGTIDSAVTSDLHGKLGTDTQFADRSAFDILCGDGPAVYPAAAAAANDVSLAEVIRYIQATQLAVGTATGDADIDISEADYTTYINILTVTAPSTGLIDCRIDIDVNKATTGWDNVATAADVLDVVAVAQIDGTNYRSTQKASAQITANGDGSLDASESGISFDIGPLAAAESIQIHVKMDTERGDCELPYRVTYVGAAPTVTPVAAA